MITEDLLQIKADGLIKQYMIWAAGAGLVPIPIADIAAIAALQLKLVAQVAGLYGASFRKEAAKATVGALVAGTATSAIAVGTSSALKVIPIVGHTAGACALSIYAAASTYAVGHVFAHHFRSGGTLLDFDPQKARIRFVELYEKALERLKRTKVGSHDGTDDKGRMGA